MGKSRTELVLVGGGHTHVQVLRHFAMEPLPDTHITVVLDRPVAIYSGMVPGFVAGQYRMDELEIDVIPLARRARARVILSPAIRVDAAANKIHVAGRPPVPYDLASFDIGSTVAGLDLPGVREHALPTRPIAELVRRIGTLTESASSPYRVLVVGGGAGGVELAFTIWERLGARQDEGIRVSLVHMGDDVLPGYPKSLIDRVHRNAESRRIDFYPNRRVVAVRPSQVELNDGERLTFDALVWVTGAVSHPVFTASDLPTESRGFVRTRSTLQIEGFDDLFAVGDCGTLVDYPNTPKAGVYAVREGPYLIDNLRAAIAGKPLRPYRPQADFLTLLNLGDGSALGAKWGVSFEGSWVMRLKDRIDRAFMEKFQVLDDEGAMTDAFNALPDMSKQMEILCGGCAAKVGQSVLDRALGRLEPRIQDDSVLLGLETPDDASAYRTPAGDTVVASVDAFRAFLDDPYLVGRVAAVNALSDLYATGASPRYALAMISIPKEASDDDSEEILYQVLSGARAVFDPHGVTLLGGHTTTSTELVVGFSVEGYGDPVSLLSVDKLEAGDELLLTKRLGTGVVLHADMKGRAKGPWLKAAIESMLTENGEAARIASEIGAQAMTDVTGFGLAGHLANMLRASGASAVVDVASLPALPGALSLLKQGFRSTFHEENAKWRKGLVVQPEAAHHPAFELLFDPQTSGGLAFGLRPDKVDEALERLDEVSVIGRVTERRSDGALIEVVNRSTSSELQSERAPSSPAR
ncbi:MAG TPA: selenide, water dikinase SelD [Vicinamibacteria bacterium]|nr:selenide, water dikinase SelD [Vicinamibacteria bacterium]